MKTITEIITKDNTPLKKLINHADGSEKLEKVFCSVLDKNLTKHCRLANYQNSELTITVTNAAWATRLRYAAPEIIKQLRIQPEFKGIRRINYMVSSNKTDPVKPKNKTVKLSKTNESLWRKTISDLKKKITKKNN